MTPEFSRAERVDTIGEVPRTIDITADADERAAIARRFGLLSVERLEARFTIRREAIGIAASGRVTAAVTQACSVTGDPLPARVDESVRLRFVEDEDGMDGEEIELTDDAIDTLPIDGGAIDLGEATAETMALALDPFPRGPNAAAKLAEAGVLSEDDASPLGALAGLKGLLGKE